MDEQFDKDIVKRIREVFDDYQDQTAGEGWRELRKKYPEDRKRRPVAWLWLGTAAAVLLLFLGVWFWIGNAAVAPIKIVNKKTKHTGAETFAGSRKFKKSANQTATAGKAQAGPHRAEAGNHETLNKGESVAAVRETKTGARTSINNSRINVSSNKAELIGRQNQITGETPVIAAHFKPAHNHNSIHPHPNFDKSTPSGTMEKESYAKKTPSQNMLTPKQVDSIKFLGSRAGAQQMPVVVAQSKPDKQDSTNNVSQTTKKSINSMFDGDKQLAKSNNEEKIKNDTKKVRFAVYAASYFNYAKGSENQVNLGAGFSAEILLNRHISLVTGVSIGQNTLNYSGSGSFAAVPGSNSLLAAAASNYYAPFANNGNINTISPTLKNYNASLVGLEIPLNLKYVFNSQKRDTYFTAGVSSGTFINETYTSQYNYPAQQTQDQTSRSSFNGFYFAKTLNVAFGTGFTLGKNRLVLEPFLKYPLEGLGVQQLRFGATGLNLKFNFKPSTK